LFTVGKVFILNFTLPSTGETPGSFEERRGDPQLRVQVNGCPFAASLLVRFLWANCQSSAVSYADKMNVKNNLLVYLDLFINH